jgi:tRNA pseudouridine55 synthase
MFGILNLNKPQGWTSRDAVNYVQKIVYPSKLGHAGTLDPLATGVLLVALGPATHLIPYLQRMPKRYLARFRFGCRSDSDDMETSIEEIALPSIHRSEFENQLSSHEGLHWQAPPKYSAIKHDGKRAYALARQGQTLALEPRLVQLHSARVSHWAWPEVEIELNCGSGFYVRALGRDLANDLGTGAVMTQLHRTHVGNFSSPTAVDPRDLDRVRMQNHLHPARTAVAELTICVLPPASIETLRTGRPVSVNEIVRWQARPDMSALAATEIAVLDPQEELAAIVVLRDDELCWPKRNFPISHGAARNNVQSH